MGKKKQPEPRIEDKPDYCHAWISKVSPRVMCNSIPCCGFCTGTNELRKEKTPGTFNWEGKGKHPFIDGK